MARTTRSRAKSDKASDKATAIDEAEVVEETTADISAETPDSPSDTPVEAPVLDAPAQETLSAPEPGPEPEPDPEPVIDPSGMATDEPAVEQSPFSEPVIEPVETPVSEPVAPAPPAPPRGTGTILLGGVLAAAIGAAAVLFVLPEGWRGATADTSALTDRIAALEAQSSVSPAALQAALGPLETRIAALEAATPADTAGLADRVAALESATPDLSPVEERLSTLEAAPGGVTEDTLNTAVGSLATRLAELEEGVAGRIDTAVTAAMADARSALDTQEQVLETREEDVAAAQQRIAERAALAELVAASESGDPQPGALATLTDAPAALAPLGEGLVTLAQLQSSFAPAAREALASVPPAPDASLGDRVASFVRAQTGARSLAPREGDDPDAVLSRAEAQLQQGNLQATLDEVDSLTGTPAEAMANWRAQAETRLAALAALAQVQTRMDGEE
ncbi:COG4223 family protein [Pararhodobacter zhoushanensis]|uniref:Mitofilin family membrane protein n=1 Tax=Pararhodobacter zhoushanensis TaxID=2479545 RepID=A0ABT3GTT4_9RHOB|nr:mitofilin family membrane protein [Pararhodobacter zhoushanensis]MCW1930909.1 mitofilin family membrane protein [Pararhodobacter zhoushanensis]